MAHENVNGFAVEINGEEIPVYEACCSAAPVNIRWPGHQRNINQTETCFAARFDFTGKCDIAIHAFRDFKEVIVRPLSRRIATAVNGRTIEFSIDNPGFFSVELDGIHHNLHLFADKIVDYSDVLAGKKVRHFGPGEHDMGLITLESGEAIYLDPMAVVYGRVVARDADDIAIVGRGILDCSRVKEVALEIDPALAEEQRKKGFAITNVRRFDAIRLEFCDRVVIDGPTIRDSPLYNIRPIACRDIAIANVKIIGSWRYNSDGIDMHNCERVRIRECFVRTFDDAICIKGFDYAMNEADMLHDGCRHAFFRDAVIEGCTVWADWGRQLEFGAETRTEEISDVHFRNCDLIHGHCAACEVQNCDYADIHDVSFEDINIEMDAPHRPTHYSEDMEVADGADTEYQSVAFASTIHVIPEYSKDDRRRGRNRDILVKNVRITARETPFISLRGFDETHRTCNVMLEGIYLNGIESTDGIAVSVGPFADEPKRIAKR